MKQLSNKIQIPVKTKIVALAALFLSIMWLIFLCFDFGVDRGRDIDFWEFLSLIRLELVLIVAYGAIAYALCHVVKIAWYVGLIVFGINFLWYSIIVARLWFHMGDIVFDILFVIPAVLNFFVLLFLIVDRKNYFAAVNMAKKTVK